MANFYGTPTEFVSVFMSKEQDEVIGRTFRFQQETAILDGIRMWRTDWILGFGANKGAELKFGGDSGWNQEVEDRLELKWQAKNGKRKAKNGRRRQVS